MLRRIVAALVVVMCLVDPVHADKIDDLTRALMQDPSYKVRVQAALVLGKLLDKRAVPALMQALKDENESVRGVAATSLGRIGNKAAANALLQATNDSSEFVRTQAKKALELVSSGPSLALPPPRPGARYSDASSGPQQTKGMFDPATSQNTYSSPRTERRGILSYRSVAVAVRLRTRS